MSDKTNSSKMFEAGMVNCFRDILAGVFTDMSAHGDMAGCLELVQFIRRFVKDMPVTDYRTGAPCAIETLLSALSLVKGKDYGMETSDLDPSSSVLSFMDTDKTKVVLGCFGGLRVKSGPSVADRLYCELCKEDNRSFKDAMKTSGSTAEGDLIKSDILSCSLKVYSTVAAADASKLDPFDVKTVEFCKKMVNGGKLSPYAPPVVPIAVAELYACLSGYLDDKTVRMFRINETDVAMDGAFAFNKNVFLPNCEYSTIPLPLASCDEEYVKAVATDAGSFIQPTYTSNSCVYVTLCSPVRLPSLTPDATAIAAEVMSSRSRIASYVSSIYSSVYPNLFVQPRRMSLIRPVDEDTLKDCSNDENLAKELVEKSNELMKSDTDAGPCLHVCGSMILSAFSCNLPRPFLGIDIEDTIPFSIVHSDKTKGDGKKGGINIANLWFSTVHGHEIPEIKGDLAEKIPEELVVANAKCESTSIPSAISIAVRTAFEDLSEAFSAISPIDEKLKYYGDGTQDNDTLHSHSRFVTQVISTVYSSSKSLPSFVSDFESGKNTSAPGFSESGNTVMASLDGNVVSKFIDIADSTNLQFRPTKTAKGFVLYAETNFSFEAFVNATVRSSALRDTLIRRMNREISRVLLLATGTSKEDHAAVVNLLKRTFSPTHSLYTTATATLSPDEVRLLPLTSIKVMPDKYGRAVLAIRIDHSAAILAILLRNPDKRNEIIEFVKMASPWAIPIADTGWEETVMTCVLSSLKAANRIEIPSKTLYEIEESYLNDYDPDEDDMDSHRMLFSYGWRISEYLTTRPFNEKFRQLVAERDMGRHDPN